MMRTRCFLLPFITLGVAFSLSAQQIQINKENKTIAITTSDQADALADLATITVGFQGFGRNQDETYAEATRNSNAIMAALNAAGVQNEAIQSVRQALGTIDPANDSEKARYVQGLRFKFEQSWRVTVPAASAAAVLHAAILAGANDSGAIDWRLKQDDVLEAEAAAKALEHAREIASRMAAGLGVKLGSLVYASNQSPPRGIFGNLGFGQMALNTQSATLGGSGRRNLAPLAISPERITKSATVYAVFAIE